MTLVEETTKKESLWNKSGGLNGLLTAVGVLALTRVGQLLMIAWLDGGTAEPRPLFERLLIWDAGWFLRVAVDGYPEGYTYSATGQLEGNELAFFPVYPMLIRLGAAIGFEPSTAALVVAWLASVGAAVALHLLGTSLYGKRAGWALVAICCSAPASVVLSMAYSESLYIALVAGMFAAAHRRVWWAAGLLGLLTALSRPTGAAAALALAVAAILALRHDDGQPKWKPFTAAAAALAGVPLYLGWVAYRVGDLTAWFKIQTAGWGTSFDYGSSTGKFLWTTLRSGDGWIPMSVALILLVALAAAGVALAQKPWLPLAVYGVVAMILVYGQAGFYHSKPRLLLPVLLTLLPAVVAAARARPRVAVLSIGAWALFGLWYGAYLVTVWPYTL
ncbi:membrane protein [Actinoplanes italicus]|uniref:Mannosyltransferase PIG-V n=1 Tax=Actinoplanes italicus TaxID=113567 RepID=A0A2T0KMQ6_9ACTN|nr:mannosyltransferase family protein [Actinoplanes italicus]PRX24918.1 mannosyltransferase PIG-V [Actinoplanes italicus]GIE27354.1 membrane protein [Actinoplanes italicus]